MRKSITLSIILLLSSLIINIFNYSNAKDQLAWFVWKDITIEDPNGTWFLIIMDRNLWATTTWIWENPPSTSYWYFYQWWNNYGFGGQELDKIKMSSMRVDASDYWPDNPYYSDTFVKWARDWSSVLNLNLWWWWTDDIKNERWYKSSNLYTDRQWPCPEWYHVPSAWEWSMLLKYRGDTYASWKIVQLANKFYYLEDKELVKQFINYFNIPFAWSRDYLQGDISWKGSRTWASFRSSSPKSSGPQLAWQMGVESSHISPNSNNFNAFGASVRCFKDLDNDFWYEKWDQNEIMDNWYTREFNNAYKFSYKNKITNIKSIKKAGMNSKLTRIAMAKMLSQYAINILWKSPNMSLTCTFNDVPYNLDLQYDNWSKLACQLWIMGTNMSSFRPNDTVTRAEFATALSRMLYWLEDWVDKYYSTHLNKLYNEWIISSTDPKIKELRWYVMLMLMRSSR